MSIEAKLLEIERQRKVRMESAEAREVTYVLHPSAREHDLFGLYMLNERGRRIGWTVRDFRVVSDRQAAPQETSLHRLVSSGTLPICVAGPFAKEGVENRDNTVTKKIARELHIDHDRVWGKLVAAFNKAHLPPGPGSWQETLGLINTVAAANSDPVAAYCIVERLLDCIRAEIMEEVDAENELELALMGRVFELPYQLRMVKLGVLSSDNEMIVRVARAKERLDLVVKIDNQTGQVLISASGGINLASVAARVRAEEARLAGVPAGEDIGKPGLSSADDRWYYDRKAGEEGWEALINGGPTSPQTPPTAISLVEIVGLVAEGLKTE